MKTSILFYNRINYLLRDKLLASNRLTKDLSSYSFNVLFCLYQDESHEITLKDLQSRLQQSVSGINDISIQLESNGYITKFKDPEDRRRFKIKLTEKGLDYVIRIDEELAKEEQILLQGINEYEKRVYMKVIKQMNSFNYSLIEKYIN